ncbi:MAG: hypothetical protein ACLSUS_07505 [Opitutales bacterium]|jgi:hypothetical protein
MTIDRKLMRNGNGWAISINSTILGFLDVNPETDMIRYTMENEKLIITKSDKKVEINELKF